MAKRNNHIGQTRMSTNKLQISSHDLSQNEKDHHNRKFQIQTCSMNCQEAVLYRYQLQLIQHVSAFWLINSHDSMLRSLKKESLVRFHCWRVCDEVSSPIPHNINDKAVIKGWRKEDSFTRSVQKRYKNNFSKGASKLF